MEREVTSGVVERLLGEARSAQPRECCGILLGEASRITAVRPAANVHPSPETHFEIDPQALVDAHRAARAGGPQVIGYYHSHPNGRAEPSAIDRAMAAGDGSVWLIVARGSINGWKDTPSGFERLSLRVRPA